MGKNLNVKGYLVEDPDFPYCPGCGHTLINKALDSALKKTGMEPNKINLITDIGCVGLVDRLFLTNTIHTTHGRSTAVATGLQLADEILFDGEATHIVMIGDGGATIGLSHLMEAAQLNANITVILHNNFLYGMTGGQHSGLTPVNFNTATTRNGNLLPPLRFGDILKASHSCFFSRMLATDHDLNEEIYKALTYKGFALIEIIELCTGYGTKWNKLTKKDVRKILENMNCEKTGTLTERSDRTTYGSLYKKNFPVKKSEMESQTIEVKRKTNEKISFSVVIAGSAGEGVQTASRLLCHAGIENGLNASQQNDNPITISTGFSMSQFILSSEEILFSAFDNPDYLIVTSEEGFKRAKKMIHHLSESTHFFLDSSIPYRETGKKKVVKLPFRKTAKSRKESNLVALGYLLKLMQVIPLKSYVDIIQQWGKNPESSIDSVKAGYEL
tara:strand:+ start:563 stop:1894 length:1332 start_codon:yes stop_codon:yes gene_type:complete